MPSMQLQANSWGNTPDI